MRSEWFETQLGAAGPIAVTPTARALAGAILRPPIRLAPGFGLDLALTPGLSLLPARLRREFGITWTAPRQLLASSMGRGMRLWVRALPPGIRAMPQTRAAERRCRRVRGPGASATIASATP